MVQYHKQDIGIDISRQRTVPSLLRSVMLPFYSQTHTLPSPRYIHSLVLCHNLHLRNLDHLSLPEERGDSNAMACSCYITLCLSATAVASWRFPANWRVKENDPSLVSRWFCTPCRQHLKAESRSTITTLWDTPEAQGEGGSFDSTELQAICLVRFA